MILWIVSRNRIHGYGISKELSNFFNVFDDYEVKINPAKIYPILKKMEDVGIVKSEEDFNNNKKVKFYEITDEGLEKLNFIKNRWAELIKDELWVEFFHDMTNSESKGD